MENDDLLRAIAAAQSGNLPGARAILAALVKADPANEETWLWLGNCLDDKQKQLFCYQKALSLNPANEAAKLALQVLNQRVSPFSQSPFTAPIEEVEQPQAAPIPSIPSPISRAAGAPVAAVFSSPPEPSAPTPAGPAAPAQAGLERDPARPRPGKWLSVGLPVLIVLLCVLPVAYLLISGQFQGLLAGLPFAPLPSVASTALPQPSFTPVPATRTPTLTPTITPTPTATIYQYTPGDFTATPLGSQITDPNFQAGVKAYLAGDYSAALGLLNLVIAADPDLAPTYQTRGMVSWNLKDCSSSLADEDKALSIDPNFAAAYTWRAVAEDCLGKQAEALADYQKALALDPSQWLVYYNLGVYYAKQADTDRSLQEFTLSTLVDPTRFEGWDGLSQALQKLGRFDECIEKAGRAIALKTDFWQAYFDRGVCYEGKLYSRSAVADFKLYVTNRPEDPQGWLHYGNVLNENGSVEAALTAYNTALARSPGLVQAYVNRGLIYNARKQYDKALSDFNAALKGGDLADAYAGRGYAFYGLKQYAKALPDFQKSVALVPSECGYAGLVLTYTELGQFQDSLDAALNSNFSDSTCGGQPLLEAQARNYYALKDYDRALTYINKAMQISVYPKGYYYRGIIEQAGGWDKLAKDDLNSFLIYAANSRVDMSVMLADARARLAQLK